MIYGDVANSITDGWASYYNHTFNAAEKNENASCYGWWYSSSYIIAQANKAATYLTDEVATSPNALPAVKTYAAQAKTLRAYGYLQLMERFRKAYKYGGSEQQGMPIYTKYAYNTPVAPSTAQETWEWIIKELEDAGTYFAAGKNSATDGYTTVNPTDLTTFYDIDRTLSDFFLARACLDYGEYDKAIAACQRILAKYPTLIDETHYGVQTSRLDDIATPLDDAWKKGKDEVRNDDNAFLSIPSNPEVLFGWTSESNLTSQTMAMWRARSSNTPILSGELRSARMPMSVLSPTSVQTKSYSVLQRFSLCWPRLSIRLARKLMRRLHSTSFSRPVPSRELLPLHAIITKVVLAHGSRSSFSGRSRCGARTALTTIATNVGTPTLSARAETTGRIIHGALRTWSGRSLKRNSRLTHTGTSNTKGIEYEKDIFDPFHHFGYSSGCFMPRHG